MNYDEAKAQAIATLVPPRLHDHYCMTIWGNDNIIEVVRIDGATVVTESLGEGTISRWPLMWWRHLVLIKGAVLVKQPVDFSHEL